MKKGTYKTLIGDCRETIKSIDNDTIDCCVTSPPYFGLRDYDNANQIGLENTIDEYVENICKVFDEIYRILKPSGTAWLNLGDSYAGSGKGQWNGASSDPKRKKTNGMTVKAQKAKTIGLKPKDLIGVPWRVAFALQSRGWYLRQDIIWNKGNPMPESVLDRCTKSHEYIFLLTKSPKYYYDYDAIKEPTVTNDDVIRDRENTKLNNVPGRARMGGLTENNYDYRNKRSVWNVNTRQYSAAHFAVFPHELIIPCILAGCPEHGTVIDPFGGSGTTAAVAVNHGRNAILCELNPDYAALIDSRIGATPPEQGKIL